MQLTGSLQKMETALEEKVQYRLPIGEARVDMNALIGHELKLHYQGEIHCVACGRKSKKSFNQGFCYPCFQRLPQCDSCVIKPEQCHHAEGTCRDEDWAEVQCMIDHYVYLANSSGLKVGITRGTQVPTRWMDQGAVAALPIFRVKDRLTSGKVEVALKAYVNDKTSWQRMLKGNPEPIDLQAARDQLFVDAEAPLKALEASLGAGAMEALTQEPIQISYPVEAYPTKVKSFNFDKTPVVEGRLQGIKGQYLIFDSGVLNIRKFGGYQVELSA